MGFDCYEVDGLSPETLLQAQRTSGHTTARIDPLAPLAIRKLLTESGFYYCDTLIEPYCSPQCFRPAKNPDMRHSQDVSEAALLEICHGAFSHGRFHRDPHIPTGCADLRYDNWLKQLYAEGRVQGLFYRDDLAGFIGIRDNCLVLHAVAQKYRGQGIAGMLWTPVCQMLFSAGYPEIVSSVSAANLAAVNLYAALGFRFRKPMEIYHRMAQ